MLVQGSLAACRLRASRVHVAVPRLLECGEAVSISVDLATRRTSAVSDDGKRCVGKSGGRVFRLAAGAPGTPPRRRSFLPVGALRRSANRGLCRKRYGRVRRSRWLQRREL